MSKTLPTANDTAFIAAHNEKMAKIMTHLANCDDANLKLIGQQIECCYAVGVRTLQRTTGEDLPAYEPKGEKYKIDTALCSGCGRPKDKSVMRKVGNLGFVCDGCIG